MANLKGGRSAKRLTKTDRSLSCGFPVKLSMVQRVLFIQLIKLLPWLWKTTQKSHLRTFA
jgi:hypothetical protein